MHTCILYVVFLKSHNQADKVRKDYTVRNVYHLPREQEKQHSWRRIETCNIYKCVDV